MKIRFSFATWKQLIHDTFRQAWASGISGMMLSATAICTLLCLSVSVGGDVLPHDPNEQIYFLPPISRNLRWFTPWGVGFWRPAHPLEAAALFLNGYNQFWSQEARARHQGVETRGGRMTLAFACAFPFALSRERGDAVHFLELLLAGGIAGTLGLLLTLVWTAGFVPTFLEPSAASVLLAKPVSRWQLLLGKYLGVLTFALAFQVVLFVFLTWLALGLCAPSVWDMAYWWCVPLLLLEFAIFYSFSILLAVVTRSTVACVFGSVLFWLLAWGINYGSVMARPPGGNAAATVVYACPDPMRRTGFLPNPLTPD